MNVGGNQGAPSSDQLQINNRKTNNAENLARLKQEASKDGLPSVIAKQGGDLILLSGYAKTESKVARVSAEEGISTGDTLQVSGAQAGVLYTDDGFKEVAAKEVIVAVIDSGLDVDHPALKGRVVSPYNAVDGSTDVTDRKKHGTHVAGIIAGIGGLNPDAEGVAPQVKIMPIKVAGRFLIKAEAIAKGIRYAVDNGAKVINMSLASTKDNPAVQEALKYAHDKGVAVVAAAGNDGHNYGLSYPARSEREVLSVGSVHEGERSGFSNGGQELDVMAPGEKIVAPVPGGKFKSKQGTSMASPYVAGVVALVVARHPDWTVDQVYAHVQSATTDLDKPGWDPATGFGQVDLFKAVYGENLPQGHKVELPPHLTLDQKLVNWVKGLFD